MADLLRVIGLRNFVCAILVSALIPCGKGEGLGGSGPGGSEPEFPSPANDRFDGRFRVEGASVELTGVLAGATLENGEASGPVVRTPPWIMGSSSVWFSWKAPRDGVALVAPKGFRYQAFVTVSTGATLSAALEVPNVVAELAVHAPSYATFNAQADVEYQIRVLGNSTTNLFEIAVGMTNLPAILEQPRDNTVSPGGAALLKIGIAVYSNELAQIQWQFRGTNLPGRTGPMLALTNVGPEMAGDYSAVVTGPDGNGGTASRTSRVARLIVKEPSQPMLQVRRDASVIYVDVEGEVGRSYVLKTMSGLNPDGGYLMWLADSAFPYRLGSGPFNGNAIGEVVYLEVHEPSSAVCNLNLKRMYFAKSRITADRNLNPGEPVLESDLEAYLSEAPVCPEGGIYTIGNVGVYPTCTKVLESHILEHQGADW